MRSEFKVNNINVSEDFSASTRLARRKLIEFGNSQEGSPKFKLRYNKLLLNHKCYTYNPVSNSVNESNSNGSTVNADAASSNRAST